VHQPLIRECREKPTGKEKQEGFAREAFTLAYRIQRIFESRVVPKELREGLTEDYDLLKEKVELVTRFREDREPAKRLRGILEPHFTPTKERKGGTE